MTEVVGKQWFDHDIVHNLSSIVLERGEAPEEEDSPGYGVEGDQPAEQQGELLGDGDAGVEQPVTQPPLSQFHWVGLNSEIYY